MGAYYFERRANDLRLIKLQFHCVNRRAARKHVLSSHFLRGFMMISRRKLIKAGVASAALIKFPGITNIAFAQSGGVPSVTFDVDDVVRGKTAFPTVSAKSAIEGILSAPKDSLESWSRGAQNLMASGSDIHPFLHAVTTAYHNHFPIIFSPDMIWLQILQGLASHINANAESLRGQFVAHDGKKLIEIRRDFFVKGNPDNDWEGAFSEFSAKMRPHIGAKTHDLIAGGYSTTGPAEQAAMNVALMDAMQSYFAYAMTTACGFPSVTLEGSVDDWQALRKRAAAFAQYDLEWWTKPLLAVLDQFVDTASGKPNKDFWCNFYKLQPVGSGTARIHGHINTFFPYFGKKKPTRDELVENFELYIRNSQHLVPRSERAILAEIAQFKRRLEDDSGRLRNTLRRNPYLGKADLTAREGMTALPSGQKSAGRCAKLRAKQRNIRRRRPFASAGSVRNGLS